MACPWKFAERVDLRPNLADKRTDNINLLDYDDHT
jgi:hypothetical protein